MALGAQDKEPRQGLFSAANAQLAAPFQTSPSTASSQTSMAMDQMLRAAPPPMGMPAASPTPAGPISRMAAAAVPPAPVPASPASAPTAGPAPVGPISQMAANPSPPSFVQQAASLPPPVATPQPGGQAELRAGDLAGRMKFVQSILGQDFGTGGPIPGAAQPAVEATPAAQPFTQGIDMALGNERMARANAIRQSQLDAAGGPSVGLIANSDAAQREQASFLSQIAALMKGGTAGRAQANALIQAAGLGQKANEAQMNNALGYDRINADVDMNQQRLAQGQEQFDQTKQLDRERLAQGQVGVEGQQIQNQQAKLMAELTTKAANGDVAAIEKLRALKGQEDPRTKLVSSLAEAYTKSAASNPLGGGTGFDTILSQVLPQVGMQPVATGAAAVAPPNGTRGVLNGKPGVVRNGQFIPD